MGSIIDSVRAKKSSQTYRKALPRKTPGNDSAGEIFLPNHVLAIQGRGKNMDGQEYVRLE
jgi:hypothetical protein